jgi:macrocin-O-methyltransferase TylF-like protien
MISQRQLFSPIKAALFRFLARRLSSFHTSPRLLEMQRCTQDDVVRAVKLARSNHPDARIFVLSEPGAGAYRIPGTTCIDSLLPLQQTQNGPCAVILACNSDELALQAIALVRCRKNMTYYGADRVAPTARYFHRNEIARKVLKDAASLGLDKFDLSDFENIIQAIDASRPVAGDYLEIGVYKGSSAYVALDYMQRAGVKRRCFFLDTFSGFDYAEAKTSSDAAWQNTHGEATYEGAKSFLSRFQVPHEVIKANIVTDPLPASITAVALCNIDVDMYEAVLAALNKVAPLVSAGGIIIAEDQGHTPLLLGAYAAVTEFLESTAGKSFVPVQLLSGQMFLVKIRALAT